MTAIRETRKWLGRFDRAQTLSTTPGQDGWTTKKTNGASATLTVNAEDGGIVVLTGEATSETQVLTLYHNDVLQFDLAHLLQVDIVAKVSGLAANSIVALGLASATNDTLDSVATNAWFRLEGASGTLLCETDDATTDKDDISTGVTLGTTYKKLTLDFSNGLRDVRFLVDGARVAAGTTFDMSALTAGLNVQPFLRVQKTSTDVPILSVASFDITYNVALGA